MFPSSGQQAREAFEEAARFVKFGRYEEALAVNLLPSDRKLIQARIAVASANGGASQKRND